MYSVLFPYDATESWQVNIRTDALRLLERATKDKTLVCWRHPETGEWLIAKKLKSGQYIDLAICGTDRTPTLTKGIIDTVRNVVMAHKYGKGPGVDVRDMLAAKEFETKKNLQEMMEGDIRRRRYIKRRLTKERLHNLASHPYFDI